jgi:hypothetical protein
MSLESSDTRLDSAQAAAGGIFLDDTGEIGQDRLANNP